MEFSCVPEKSVVKSSSAIRPNYALRIAEGALKPEFEVGEVNTSFLPLISPGDCKPLSAGTMISISYPNEPSTDAIIANGTTPAI